MSVTPSVLFTSFSEVEQFARDNSFNVTIVGRKETKRFFGLYVSKERLRVIVSDEPSFELGKLVIEKMLAQFGEVEMWKNLSRDLELSSKFLPPGVRSD